MNPFPKGYTIGAAGCAPDILEGAVELTEKIDGSQFGFGKINGELFIRSKGRQIHKGKEDGMFAAACETVYRVERLLPEDVTFYSEQLSKPKHNVIKYDRVPKGNIALFGCLDIESHTFQPYDTLVEIAGIYGIDVVRKLTYFGEPGNSPVTMGLIKERLDTESQLGGAKIEGIYFKKYEPWVDRFGHQHRIKVAKYVSEAFKEVAGNQRRKVGSKPNVESLLEAYRTEARWYKAIQHLRDNGSIVGHPKDIGPLIREIQNDVIDEEKENIKNQLWAMFKGDLQRKVVGGFPEFYKQLLVEEFTNEKS